MRDLGSPPQITSVSLKRVPSPARPPVTATPLGSRVVNPSTNWLALTLSPSDEHDDMRQTVPGQLPRQALAGLFAVAFAAGIGVLVTTMAVVEGEGGGDNRVVEDLGLGNLAGRGAPEQVGSGYLAPSSASRAPSPGRSVAPKTSTSCAADGSGPSRSDTHPPATVQRRCSTCMMVTPVGFAPPPIRPTASRNS